MSIFSNIANAEHTFVAWAEKEWAKFEKEAPKLEKLADQSFVWAQAVLKVVLTQVGPTSDTGKVITEVLHDLSTASAVVYDAGANPTAGSLISDIVTNLSGLLSAGHVKDAGTLATITKVVSTLSVLVSAFVNVAPVVAAVA